MRLAALLALALLAAPGLAAGESPYVTHCGKCHGADGKADTPVAKAMKIASFEGQALTAESVVELVRSDPKHKGASAKLDDALLAEIARHVEALSAGGD